MSEEEKNDKKELLDEEKNRDFIQIYRGYIDSIAKLARENCKAYDLFMLLCKHMDGFNALCVSNIALQELLDCGRATICRAINYLKTEGWICVLKSGTSNVYIVNPDVVWTSYANQKQLCKFQAMVLLSSSENKQYLKNNNAFNKFKTVNTSFIKNAVENEEKFKERAKEIKVV